MKKKRQKQYSPSPAVGKPLQLYTDELARSLQLVPHLHLDQFKAGVGTSVGWASIATRINFGQVLAARHFGEGPQQALQAGIEAIQQIFANQARSGQYAMTEEQASVIGATINLVDDMQSNTARSEHIAALQYILKMSFVENGKSDAVEIQSRKSLPKAAQI